MRLWKVHTSLIQELALLNFTSCCLLLLTLAMFNLMINLVALYYRTWVVSTMTDNHFGLLKCFINIMYMYKTAQYRVRITSFVLYTLFTIENRGLQKRYISVTWVEPCTWLSPSIISSCILSTYTQVSLVYPFTRTLYLCCGIVYQS